MTRGRLVFSDFVPAVRAIVDVEAFGVVLARPERQAQLVTRHRAGVAAHLLPVDRLPSVLTRSAGATTVITPLHEHDEAAHPLFDRLGRYGIDCLLVMPLPDVEGLFWAGKRGAPPFTGPEIAAFAPLTADLVAAMRGQEPPDVRLARLARLDAVEQMLTVIAGALDVRDVFHRLSDIARAVLPHDAASIQILSDDRTHVRVYALDGIPRADVPDEFPTDYAPVFNEHYEFSLHDDLLASSAERDRPAAKAGRRSALRVPLRFDGRIGAALEFSSTAVAAYRETDVDVARRIAEFVMLALAHQRMAEEAHHAAALRERADNLVMLDDLLAALSGVLDVREVFDRVSVIARKVLKHDAMAVTIITSRGAPPPRGDAFAASLNARGAPPPLASLVDLTEHRIRVHALSGFVDFPPFIDAPLPEPELLTEPWDFRIIDDMAADPRYAASPTFAAGMRSVLGLPVRFEGRLHYGVNFYSRSAAAFTRDDALVGRRIADHVALALSHQRLAEASRSNAELKASTANLELLDELLATMTDAGPLGELFDRVSAVAKKVIPHDAMTVPVLRSEGAPMPEEFQRDATWEYDVIDEAAERPEPFNQQLAASGFHSALRVPIRLDGRLAAGLAFMSHAAGVYTDGNVLAARRIAERFALCLSRERGAAASKRADEAAARASQLESRVRALAEELDARTGYRRVIGESAAWRQVLTQAAQVAPTDTTVLLLGESGTGKEVVARFVHRASARRDGPFIALNCAALPEQLLEAELFGYERGAFTGATHSKPGQLEQAGGGTLFLDEVGEMSLPVQAKLLRVLQEREFQRLGGTRVLRTDARVVAATNRNLQHAIAHGRFREDLFYRLNVFAIHLPPLRDRRDDVLPLCDAFLVEYGRSLGRPPAGISRDARQRLMDYHWPGNVRELRNILERAAILCDGGLITADHLALTVAPPPVEMARPRPSATTTTATSPAGDLNAMERSMIEEALQTARFNKSKAAQALGLTRAQLYVRMRKHGLE